MTASLGLSIGMVWSVGASAGVTFTLTELNLLNGDARSFANAINNDGSIIVNGQWVLPTGGGAAIELRPVINASSLPVTGYFAGGIDSAGMAVGHVSRDRGSVTLTRWDTKAPGSFNTVVGVEAAVSQIGYGVFYAGAVNDVGQIVGGDRANYGYELDPTTGVVNLDTQLGGHYGRTNPTGINNAGQVVGSIDGSLGFVTTPSLTSPSVSSWYIGPTEALRPVTPELGPLLGINNLGVIVGTDAQGSFISYSTLQTAFANPLPSRAIYRPVIDPSSTASLAFANAINDDGLIVGETSTGKAALLTPHGTLYWGGGDAGLPQLDFNDARNWGEQVGSTLGPQPFGPNKLLDIQVSGQTIFQRRAAVVSSNAITKSLTLGDAADTDQGGQLEVSKGAVLNALDGVSVYANSGLGGDGTIVVGRPGAGPGRFEVNANLDLHPAGLTLSGGPLVNQGSIFADGALTANLVNKGNLVVGLGSTRTFKLIGTRHENQGGISVTAGSTLAVQGPLIHGDDTGAASGGALYLAGTLRMNDALTLRHTVVEVQPGGAIDGSADITQSGGRFVISAGGTVNAHSFTVLGGDASALLTVDGTLDTWPAGDAQAIVSLQAGVLNGNGRINGELFVGGGPGTAVFKPGHSPGSFTINGGFTLLPGGELALEVERGTLGSGGALAFDVVSAQHIVLDGLVRIKLGADLGNTSLQSLQLLNCGSGCEFGSHFSWLLEGGDGQALPNFSAQGLQLSVPAAAVPEPASWLLWLAGVAGCCLRIRKPICSTPPRTST